MGFLASKRSKILAHPRRLEAPLVDGLEKALIYQGFFFSFERGKGVNPLYLPWHRLYFLPLPHGHGSLRPTFSAALAGSFGRSLTAP